MGKKIDTSVLGKLERIKHKALNKQNELNELIQKIKERNQEDIWLSIDLLIDECNREEVSK